MSKTVCVVPSIRPESMIKFVDAWTPLFIKHNVLLVTVWDGDNPFIQTLSFPDRETQTYKDIYRPGGWAFKFTDSVRNLGFFWTAVFHNDVKYVLTLDDDVTPIEGDDPIQAHKNVLEKRVSLSWMNTAMWDSVFLRGVPYETRRESPVMLSHGVWHGVPDLDGETQLAFEKKGIKYPMNLPFFVGPIPKGAYFPLCGMNVMVRRDALPYLYYAPMGPCTDIPGLNRFGDIWMGIHLKREFDKRRWACYTGGAAVMHARASDAAKNAEAEKLGREWNETYYQINDNTMTSLTASGYYPKLLEYYKLYKEKRDSYARTISTLLERA